jgi:hypothetical protein
MMVEGLPKESRIHNPMSRNILKLEINDQMQTMLKSDLPPRDTAKVLISTAIDLIFGYVDALADASKTKLSG